MCLQSRTTFPIIPVASLYVHKAEQFGFPLPVLHTALHGIAVPKVVFLADVIDQDVKVLVKFSPLFCRVYSHFSRAFLLLLSPKHFEATTVLLCTVSMVK